MDKTKTVKLGNSTFRVSERYEIKKIIGAGAYG